MKVSRKRVTTAGRPAAHTQKVPFIYEKPGADPRGDDGGYSPAWHTFHLYLAVLRKKRKGLPQNKVDEIPEAFILEGVGWFYIKARPLTYNCCVGCIGLIYSVGARCFVRSWFRDLFLHSGGPFMRAQGGPFTGSVWPFMCSKSRSFCALRSPVMRSRGPFMHSGIDLRIHYTEVYGSGVPFVRSVRPCMCSEAFHVLKRPFHAIRGPRHAPGSPFMHSGTPSRAQGVLSCAQGVPFMRSGAPFMRSGTLHALRDLFMRSGALHALRGPFMRSGAPSCAQGTSCTQGALRTPRAQ